MKFFSSRPGRANGSGIQRVNYRVILLFALGAGLTAQSQQIQPFVAVHDSELTRALETMPAVAPTPTGPGTTGNQWWTLDWHYFVMPEAMQEALRSDGTPFVKVGDSNITAGVLLTNGLPKYPIVISLASEAIRNDEIAQFTNYVAAGGFLFVGGSAFTRNTNGTTRGDFAFGNAMGVHMVNGNLVNWTQNNNFTKTNQSNHRLVSHIPDGQLSWRMPTSAEEIPWGISPSHPFLAVHDLWQIQPADATVLARGDTYPYLVVKQYGKGYFIYDAGFQPLVGHGGFSPGMYAYVILRRAIEWAFESANMPLPKLSPWPYPYDAAFMVRHDLENFTNEIAAIEASAQFEFTNGAKGDYFFCTGCLRDDASPTYDTNAMIAGIRRAVTNYGATICPHNGGLKNPNNPALVRGQYDWWHWGPDEALDVTPTNYPSGKAYALTSISNSFRDIEGWLSGITNGIRTWNACYFNATREDSRDIQAQLNVKITGDEKISPFPHWTLSSLTSGKRYGFLTEPVSDWFVGGLVAQSLEPWHPPGVQTSQTLHQAVDFYYGLGALINFYSHSLSTGLGDAGQLVPDYVTYCANTNLHPRIWSADSVGVYQWWLQRSNTQATVTYSTNGHQCVSTLAISGSGNTNAAIEVLVPASGLAYSLQVLTNSVLASSAVYRTNGQMIKVRVGTAVTNASVRYILGPRAQDDFYSVTMGTTLGVAAPGVLNNDLAGLAPSLTAALVGGPAHGTLSLSANGGFTYTPASNFFGNDTFTYQAVGDQTNASTATVTISVLAPGSLFIDDFTRATDPGALSPWIVQSGTWTVTGGVMKGGTNPLQTYAFSYITNSWSNYSVQARLQFPVGAFGGGLGGRLNPTNGAHYAAWVYPEGSPGGSSVLKLIKFQNWTTFGYNGNSGLPIQQVNLASVGTNFHTVKLAFHGARIAVYFDGVEMISATDAEATPYFSGAVSLDMWTDTIGYVRLVDDVLASVLVVDDAYTMSQNTMLTVPAPGVLGNDTEVYGTNLTASLASGPTTGSLTLNANGGFTYTPPTNFSGTASFTYQANDGQTNLGTAAVIISVGTNGAPNTAPVLPVQGDRTIAELTTLTVTNTATDADLPPQTLTYSFLAAPTNTAISSSGVITWTPSEAQGPSTNTFTTRVVDNGSPPLSATNTFSVTVTEVNSAPVLPNQTNRTIAALNTLTVTNTATDSDIPANTLTYSFLAAPTNAALSANGVISWTPTSAQASSTNTFTTRVVDNGFPPLSGSNSFMVTVLGNPVIVVDSTSLAIEACLPTNNAIDPGETVTVSFALRNTGNGNTVQLVATLLETNGVVAPSAPQTYGVLTAGDGVVAQPFTFAATGTCGGTITANLQLQDGPVNLGTATVSFTLGQVSAVFTQNFDTVSAPALPPGWTTSATGVETNWVTQTTVRDTLPNAAFSPDSLNVGLNELVSPAIVLPSGSSQLSFRNNYDLEYETAHPTNGYDGGVLEIKIGTNAFTDILAAGGTFLSNAYPATINPNYFNPLAGRKAWSGDSGGFTNCLVNLPAAAAGQTIQLRWRCGTDNGNGNTGWRIDTIAITGRSCCVNTAPSLPAQADQTIAELTALVITNTATDTSTPPGGLAYALISPPAGAQIDGNGVITWTPSEAQGPGTYIITTVVTDNGFPPLSDTNSFNVTVTEANSAPTLPIQSDRTVNELTTLVVINTATDSDIPANVLAYSLQNPPGGAQIDGNGVITWMPSEAQGPGAYAFTTVVSDNGVPPLSATNSFNVTVNEVNSAPVLAVPANQTIDELTTLAVSASATDSDIPTNTLTFSLLSPPGGMTINPASGAINWTPSEAQGPSTNTITVVVTDNGVPPLSATNTFTVTVNEVNNAPPVFPVQTDRTINELTTLVVTNTAADPDIPATLVTYLLLAGPTNAVISTNGVITWTPTEAQGPSTNTFIAVATDSGVPPLSATNSFTVTVNEVNSAPTLPNQGNRTINELTTLTVTNTATDSDIPANHLSYALANPPAGAQIDTNGVITWTPSESQGPGTNTLTTVVTDDGVPPLNATNAFSVTVNEVNSAPLLPNQTNVTVTELTTLVVTNTATDFDIPANTLTYTLLSPPAGAQIDASGVITWTPTDAQGPGSYTLTTRVTDNGVPPLSATNSFGVAVTGTNNFPPVFAFAQTNRTINELTTLTVTNSATDPDLPPTSITYTLLTASTNVVISTNGVITWTPNEAQGPSTNIITTVATDSGIPPLSATNSFTVTVNEVNSAPVLPTPTNLTIAALVAMTVTNTATDSDIPTNTLTYSLLAAPTNAAISANGIITWTPTLAQDRTTNTFTTRVVDNGAPSLSATNTFTVVVNSSITVVLDSTALAAEGCAPGNNAIDPGETVIVLFAFRNTGGVSASNLVVTLLATNGVASPSAPQNYGTLTGGGPPVSQPFTFAATGACGGTITANLRLQYGATNTGATNIVFTLGQVATVLTQNFDSVTAPALPSGWTSSASNAQSAWITTNSLADTAPNAAYSTDAGAVGVNELDSPAFTLPAGSSQLSFRQNYFLEPNTGTNAGDGGVLEIKIGTNNYVDILAAGGSFATGGYNYKILTAYGNPLAGRSCWSGNSGGYTNVLVNLPSSAAGKTNQLRWRCGTDNGQGEPGWRIDSIAISGRVCCANTAPTLPNQTNRTIAELTALVVNNGATDLTAPPGALTYTLVNPPNGAKIDTNGIITWTPTEAQGPSTNTLTTIVTDSAFPPLRATNSFAVTVTEVNSPPVLPNQTNFTISKFTSLIVTNTATDSDIPPNSLFYTFLTAPAGAAIDASGIITWTPDETQSPSTNTFTTQVTDNGLPPLSATNSFLVFVDPQVGQPPPVVIQSLNLSSGVVTVTWSAQAGRTYRLQYRDNWIGTNWNDLAPDVVATGPTASATNAVNNAVQRFYRVVLLP